MPARTESERLERDLRYHRRTIAALLVVIVALSIGWIRAAGNVMVYMAPDVTKAITQRAGEVPHATIYGFARTLLEAIYYCDSDCAKEYENLLGQYRPYITNRCMNSLQDHYNRNRNLYTYRSRMLLPTENALFAEERVEELSFDSWIVHVEYELRETVNDNTVREQLIHYPMRIVRSHRPLNSNPLGLEFDCFSESGPVILSTKEETS